jgi:hypothetical protein
LISPYENLIIKLWETLADKGIGSLLKPWQIKREGKAVAKVQAEAIILLAQAEKTAEEIRSGKLNYVEGQLKTLPNDNSTLERVEPYIELDSLPQLMIKNNVQDSIRKEINVSKAILIAHETLANDPEEPPEESIDADWLYRWRDYAGEVSTDELQALWGNLLAGKLKNPKSFSLRTLEFLRNLSKEEAEKIELLNTFVIDSWIYLDNTPLLDKAGLDFSVLLGLQELGVISGVDGTHIQITIKLIPEKGQTDKFITNCVSNNKVLLISSAQQYQPITLTVCTLSTLGRQILSLGKFVANDEYLKYVGTRIKAQGFNVSLANFVGRKDGLLYHSNPPEVL